MLLLLSPLKWKQREVQRPDQIWPHRLLLTVCGVIQTACPGGAAPAGQCSVGLASLDLRQGRRAGLLVSSESLFPPFPFPFCILASSSNFVLSFLPVFPKLCKKSHLCFSLDPQSWVRAPPPETFHPLHLSPTTRNALWHDCWVTLSLEFLADKSLILLARFATQKPCQWRASTSWVFTLWLFRKQQAFAMLL